MRKDSIRRRAATRHYWAARPMAGPPARAGAADRAETTRDTASRRHPVTPGLGPYETSYDVRRGYDEETRLLQP